MIYRFRGEHSWLSNFYGCPINLKGRTYKSVEAAYMSEKNDTVKWKKYCQNYTASEIKKKSNYIEVRGDWEDVKLSVMKVCLYKKFIQSPFRRKLLNTENQNIVEGNYHNDRYWGVDLKNNPNIGENMLGRLIMEVRESLKNIFENKE